MELPQMEWTEVSEAEIAELPPGRVFRKEVQCWTRATVAPGMTTEVESVRYFQPAADVASSKRTFRIPNGLYRAAQEKAESAGETVSDVVRRMVREYVEGVNR